MSKATRGNESIELAAAVLPQFDHFFKHNKLRSSLLVCVIIIMFQQIIWSDFIMYGSFVSTSDVLLGGGLDTLVRAPLPEKSAIYSHIYSKN